MGLKWETFTDSLKSADLKNIMSLVDQNTDVDHNTVEKTHPMVLSAQANAQDNPTWDQAMNGPCKEEYCEAAIKEYKTLIKVDACEVVDKEP